jgi:hypothetical protein
MTITAAPFVGGADLSATGWAELWNAAVPNGVIDRGVDGSGLPASLRVYSDEDGRQVKVAPGSGHIRGIWFSSDTTERVTIGVNTSPSERFDLVVARLDLKAGNVTFPPARQGTPGELVPPPVTQDPSGVWEIPLAIVGVGTNEALVPATSVSDARFLIANKTTSILPPQLRRQSWGVILDGSGNGYVDLPGVRVEDFIHAYVLVQNPPVRGSYQPQPRVAIVAIAGGIRIVLTSGAASSGYGVYAVWNEASAQTILNPIRWATFNPTLDPSGNGYVDLVGVAVGDVIEVTSATADPATLGSYRTSPKFALSAVSGSTRISIVNGVPSQATGFYVQYHVPTQNLIQTYSTTVTLDPSGNGFFDVQGLAAERFVGASVTVPDPALGTYNPVPIIDACPIDGALRIVLTGGAFSGVYGVFVKYSR